MTARLYKKKLEGKKEKYQAGREDIPRNKIAREPTQRSRKENKVRKTAYKGRDGEGFALGVPCSSSKRNLQDAIQDGLKLGE